MKRLKRVVIREELVALTGDFVKAVILSQFIYWSERVQDFDKFIEEEKERCKNDGQEISIYPTEGWIYKSAEELAEETMLGKAPSSMRSHITYLVENQWLLERTNPHHKWDRTKQYRVNIAKIQRDLECLGYSLEGYPLAFSKIENAFSKIKNGVSKIENQTNENRKAIPEITTDITKDDDEDESAQCIHEDQQLTLALTELGIHVPIETRADWLYEAEGNNDLIVQAISKAKNYLLRNSIDNFGGFVFTTIGQLKNRVSVEQSPETKKRHSMVNKRGHDSGVAAYINRLKQAGL